MTLWWQRRGRPGAERGAVSLAVLVVVPISVVALTGIGTLALAGAARAQASAAADAAALAGALALGGTESAVADAAAELATRNGASLVTPPVVDPTAGEVEVTVAVWVDLPIVGRRSVQAAATARLE